MASTGPGAAAFSGRRTTGRLASVALVTVLMLVQGCGRRRPTPPASTSAPLEVKLVWHLGLSPSGDWLVFESILERGRDMVWSVSWLMPATGGTPEPLEPTSVGSSFPVWSPQAEEVAYVRVGQRSTLRVRPVDEAEPRLALNLGSLWLSQLCWSPDGSHLAALATDLSVRRRDLLLVDALTAEKHMARLASPAAVSPLLFTAQGDALLLAYEEAPSEPGQQTRLHLVRASTSGPESAQLGTVEATHCLAAILTGRPGEALLLQLRHPQPLALPPQPPTTKEMVLFVPVSEPEGEATITSLGEGTFASAQSLRRRDGLVELVFERAGDLFIQNLQPTEGEEPRRITETRDLETSAIFTPDGESVYFVRGAPGSRPTQVVVRSLSDGRETVIATVTPELVKELSDQADAALP